MYALVVSNVLTAIVVAAAMMFNIERVRQLLHDVEVMLMDALVELATTDADYVHEASTSGAESTVSDKRMCTPNANVDWHAFDEWLRVADEFDAPVDRRVFDKNVYYNASTVAQLSYHNLTTCIVEAAFDHLDPGAQYYERVACGNGVTEYVVTLSHANKLMGVPIFVNAWRRPDTCTKSESSFKYHGTICVGSVFELACPAAGIVTLGARA